MIQRSPFTLICTFAVAVMFLLTGCEPKHRDRATDSKNGGATPTASMQLKSDAAIASTNDVDDGRPVIACFGDSLTAGLGVDVDSSYPADLQRELDKAGYHYRVVNMGISGDTTKDALARIDRVLAMKPAITVVEFGGNDGLRGVPVANSRQNLDDILGRLTHTGTQVALAGITLPPQYSAPYIKDFNETYTVLAKKYSVPLLPFVLQDVYGVPGSIQSDGIHPTAQGCKQVAKNVLNLIQPMLKK
ncbi:arylesterase [Terriglobus roseus]|uniref:Acyl-CoA thioesterase-1 n=1 Tax=Terriglobus roseus TaxID=392734 RepID=A0A1G7H6E4_9BACT|nr:arylesterase [Terriglobus roseus]SDE95834.1 acyl-CoA thioesterase-1 [Terriglobus roseus]